MAQLPPGSEDYEKATNILRGAPSFECKCERFFDEGDAHLQALATMGVSPHVVAASLVLHAWDWTIPDHNLLHHLLMQSPEQWEQRWQTLDQAVMVLKILQYVALQADLAGQAVHPTASPSTPTTAKTGKDQSLAVRVEDAARKVTDLRAELLPVVEALKSAPAKPPDEKLNSLLLVLATVNEKLTGHPRYERIAELLNAANLFGPYYFNKENVRQRWYALQGTERACQIEREVEKAIAQAGIPTVA